LIDGVGFGIDFGTTNSVAASVALDGPAYPYLEAGSPHPSFVWYSPDGVQVGRQAKANFNAFVEQAGHRFIRSVKRDLGHGRDYDILGQRVPAWKVASQIFARLKATALADPKNPGEINEAVVTVPIHFGGAARQELRAAAREAGIEILTFVHEPFAAVVGYYRSMQTDLRDLDSERILVFDWGGGTLDVTLAKVGDGRIEELATSGIGDIAGDHFDEAIRGWAVSRFRDRHSIAETVRPDARTEDRIIAECERRKIELSSVSSTTVDVPNVINYEGRWLDVQEPIDRPTFEDLIAPDMDRAIAEVDAVIADTRLTNGEIDRVLLIGGSSGIPKLRDEMARRFGARAVSVPNSQTVIAEGAAAIAYHRYVPYLVHPIVLMLADGASMTVLDRDELLPMSESIEHTLFCTDNRDGVARLVIAERQHERDRRSVHHHGIVSVPVHDSLPKPYQHERVVAQFQIDDDLILHVTGFGIARQEVVRSQFYDLRFGLRVS
jgi:molecular chaperone DnaK (HSP70)